MSDQQITPDQLRSEDNDCIAVADDPSLRGLGDEQVFASAQAEERTVVTYARDDYAELHHDYVAAGTASMRRALSDFVTAFRPQPSLLVWLAEAP